MNKMKKQVIQKHHISYDPEITVKIYQGEHWAITQLNRRTRHISKGFIECLRAWIAEHEGDAVDLNGVG